MKNLLSRTKSGRRKGSLGLVLDSDAAEGPTNGAAAAPAPADAVEDANHSDDVFRTGIYTTRRRARHRSTAATAPPPTTTAPRASSPCDDGITPFDDGDASNGGRAVAHLVRAPRRGAARRRSRRSSPRAASSGRSARGSRRSRRASAPSRRRCGSSASRSPRARHGHGRRRLTERRAERAPNRLRHERRAAGRRSTMLPAARAGSTVALRRSISGRPRARARRRGRRARSPSARCRRNAATERPPRGRTRRRRRDRRRRPAARVVARGAPVADDVLAVRRYYQARAAAREAKGAAEAKGEPEPGPSARPARRLTDAKGVEPGRYGDGDESPTTPLFAGPPPSPGGLVDQTEEDAGTWRDALFTVKTALVEMRTRSSLVSDSCDSDDVRAPL